MMKNKFLLNMLILSLANAGTTIIYFAQMYLLYHFFEPNTVYLATVSYAYLAQGAGLLAFMLLFQYQNSLIRRRFFLTGIMISFIPILFCSLLTRSGGVLMGLVLLNNLMIGYVLGNCFTNIAAFVDGGHVGLCWGSAYAIGNILSWLVSQIDSEFITTLKIAPVICLVIGITIVPIVLSEDLPELPGLPEIEERNPGRGVRFLLLALVILLMTVIYTIGSSDYSMIAEKVATSSTFYTRCVYAAGLFLAGWIYDKNHNAGAVLALASIIYPIMATVLLKMEFQINLVYCMSYFFLGFLAVYRSGIFISMAGDQKKHLFMAGMGLLISRFAEGIFSFLNSLIARDEVSGFIISGILFIPLIIVFCMMILDQNQPPQTEEEKMVAFARDHQLTRREEEIVRLLVLGSTNGEIAEALMISESTARFHVSNVLKKTGCRTRNDVVHIFKER